MDLETIYTTVGLGYKSVALKSDNLTPRGANARSLGITPSPGPSIVVIEPCSIPLESSSSFKLHVSTRKAKLSWLNVLGISFLAVP